MSQGHALWKGPVCTNAVRKMGRPPHRVPKGSLYASGESVPLIIHEINLRFIAVRCRPLGIVEEQCGKTNATTNPESRLSEKEAKATVATTAKWSATYLPKFDRLKSRGG